MFLSAPPHIIHYDTESPLNDDFMFGVPLLPIQLLSFIPQLLCADTTAHPIIGQDFAILLAALVAAFKPAIPPPCRRK